MKLENISERTILANSFFLSYILLVLRADLHFKNLRYIQRQLWHPAMYVINGDSNIFPIYKTWYIALRKNTPKKIKNDISAQQILVSNLNPVNRTSYESSFFSKF
jgi:hypothetical protein